MRRWGRSRHVGPPEASAPPGARLHCGAVRCWVPVGYGQTLCPDHAAQDLATVRLRRCVVRGCADVARVGYVCYADAGLVEAAA